LAIDSVPRALLILASGGCSSAIGPSGASPVPALGLLDRGCGAAELDHELVDDAVKMQPVVKAVSLASLMKLPAEIGILS